MASVSSFACAAIRDLGTLSLKFARCVKRVISLAGINKLFYVSAIDVATLTLLVRAVFSTLSHTFIDAYAQPFKSFVDILLCSRHKTLRIGIFDTQNHFTAMTARKKIVVECCTHTADMQRTSGRRGKSHADFTFHILYTSGLLSGYLISAKLRIFTETRKKSRQHRFKIAVLP